MASVLLKIRPPLFREEMEQLKGRVQMTLEGKSRSYVEDARDYGKIVLDYITLRFDHAQALMMLEDVQRRCTELLLENRELRGSFSDTEPPDEDSKPVV
jgi:hypothetical protein